MWRRNKNDVCILLKISTFLQLGWVDHIKYCGSYTTLEYQKDIKSGLYLYGLKFFTNMVSLTFSICHWWAYAQWFNIYILRFRGVVGLQSRSNLTVFFKLFFLYFLYAGIHNRRVRRRGLWFQQLQKRKMLCYNLVKPDKYLVFMYKHYSKIYLNPNRNKHKNRYFPS